MTKNSIPQAIGSIALTALLLIGGAAPALATYSLVWSDEFEGTSLNAANWTIDVGNGCPSLCGWGNNELEWYRPENVTVTGGDLVLTAREEYYGGSSYTSGKVLTRDKQDFLYGRVEMRAKLPYGGGLWPAFWMMPQDNYYGGWALSGEIDIMESSNTMTSVGGALHYGGQWPDNTSTSSSTSLGGTSFADAYHVYAVEWEPTVMRWYVDGALFMTRVNTQWYSEAAPGNPLAPFDQPFYIILNLAVGGWYTGCTEPACVTAAFPQEYRIDYVRVYEDIDNFPPTVAITAPVDGATLPAGDLTITADAADSDGTVTTVEFYDGATLLGEDATTPYAYTWTGVVDGCYQVTARAIDDLGGVTTDTVDITVGAGCGQAAYLGSPYALPARIQAEDFDTGGAEVAYHDATAGNTGGAYRTDEDVDIESCSDAGGGYNVGWIDAGEWLEFQVDVPVTGGYSIDVRYSSLSAGGTVHVEFGGVDATGSVTLPATTGWQTWATVSTPLTLTQGPQTMRLVAETSGFNLNYIEIQGGPTAVGDELPAGRAVLHPCSPNPFNPQTTIRYSLPESGRIDLAVYDLSGKRIRTLAAGEFVAAGDHAATWNGRDDSGRFAATGVYFFRLDAGGTSSIRRATLVK